MNGEYIFVNMDDVDAYDADEPCYADGQDARRLGRTDRGRIVTAVLKRIAQFYVDLVGAFLLMLLMASAIALWLASLWAPLYLAANHSPWFLLLLLLAPLTTVAMLTPFTEIRRKLEP
jgi:hypothetical protein